MFPGLPDWAINRKMGYMKIDFATEKMYLRHVANWAT
jgi:hypothetical protein